MVIAAETYSGKTQTEASCARPFCAFHPVGVSCRYCSSHPHHNLPPNVSRSIRGTEQTILDAARSAQRAYWDAMSSLECVTGLEIDWEDIDLAEYTLLQLRKDFPRKH